MYPISGATRPWYGPLTPKEAQVAEFLAAGFTRDEAAALLGISEREASARVIRIMWRLGLSHQKAIAGWVRTNRPATDEGLEPRG